MIIEAILLPLTLLLKGILRGFSALVPDVPLWVRDVSAPVSWLLNHLSVVSEWVPIGFMFGVAGSILACMLIGLFIKIARIVASFLTAGGGSAA